MEVNDMDFEELIGKALEEMSVSADIIRKI